MSTVVLVAIIGVGSAAVTALGAILVAVINSGREKVKSTAAGVEKAEEKIEAALRERILLRDEQLQDCKEEVAELEAENERLRKSS